MIASLVLIFEYTNCKERRSSKIPFSIQYSMNALGSAFRAFFNLFLFYEGLPDNEVHDRFFMKLVSGLFMTGSLIRMYWQFPNAFRIVRSLAIICEE
jgi:hypothetical protein